MSTEQTLDDTRLRDRLLALLKNTEPLRQINTTALTTVANEMLAMAERVGWVVTIEDESEELR